MMLTNFGERLILGYFPLTSHTCFPSRNFMLRNMLSMELKLGCFSRFIPLPFPLLLQDGLVLVSFDLLRIDAPFLKLYLVQLLAFESQYDISS